MNANVNKSNTGKLLVAILAFSMIVVGCAVMLGDSTVDAASSETQEQTSTVSYDDGSTTVYYDTLTEALSAVKDGDKVTITLLKDSEGRGIQVTPTNGNKTITIDFAGFTYNVTETVGSTGTETSAAQLLKGNTVTFKNGTLASDNALRMIQNYSDLTLEDMTIDGSNMLPGYYNINGESVPADYVSVATNCGDVVIKGKTNIIQKDISNDATGRSTYSIGVSYWNNNTYGTEGTSLTFDTSFTGEVGNIQMDRSDDGGAGTATAEIFVNANMSFPVVDIQYGKFTVGEGTTVNIDSITGSGEVSVGNRATLNVDYSTIIPTTTSGTVNINANVVNDTDTLISFNNNKSDYIVITGAFDLTKDVVIEDVDTLVFENATVDYVLNAGKVPTLTIEGALESNSSYLYIPVILKDQAVYSATGTHNLESNGDLQDDIRVGFGDTLTMSGTVSDDLIVDVFGTLVTSDLTINGTVNAYAGSDITINGTVTVAKSFVMNGSELELAGTITVRNDKDGGASFDLGADSKLTVLENGTFNVNRATGNGADANALTVADNAEFIVEGTLNITGTLNGAIQDKGAVTFNGTAGTKAGIVVYDGVTLEVTSVSGSLTVSDSENVILDYAGKEKLDTNSEKSSYGNSVTLDSVRGVSVSVSVSDATYQSDADSSKRIKVYTSDMTVTGTVSKVTSAASGSITINGGATAVDDIKSDDTVIGTMTVGDMSLGRNLTVTFDGNVTVAGTFNANVSQSNDGGITLTNSADSLTVTGTMILGEGVTGFSTANLNAAYYYITSTDNGTVDTYYYTNFANAIAAIGDAEDDMVLIYGQVAVSADAEIPNGATVQTQSGAKLVIGSDVTLTVADGGVLDVSSGSNSNKAVDVNGVLIITNNGTGLVGSASAVDYDVLKTSGNTDTYSSLAYALANAASGETIKLSSIVTLDSDTVIPEGVTLAVPRNTGVTLNEDVTLTVNGTLAVQGGAVGKEDGTTWGDDVIIAVNGVMSMTGQSDITAIDDYMASGAYFIERGVAYVTNVAYAAENVDNGTITIMGQVSFGDVTFTERDNGTLEIFVQNNGTTETVVSAGTITLDGARLNIATGTVTGTVEAAANGSTASIQLDRVKAESGLVLDIESSTVSDIDGDVDVLYLARTVNAGTVTIASGTVTVGTGVSGNTKALFVNSESSEIKTGALVVAQGATLDVPEGASITARAATDADDTVFTVAGTLSIDNAVNVYGNTVVEGTVEVNDNADLNVYGSMAVAGTVNISETENRMGTLSITGTVSVNGIISGQVDIVDNAGYLKAYPDADLASAHIEWNYITAESSAESTVFNVNGEPYMTVYGTSGSTVTINSLIKAETFDMPGYDVGYNTNTQTGLYLYSNWYTTEAMTPGSAISNTDTVAKYDALYAEVEVANVIGTISEGTGLTLYIDGLTISNWMASQDGRYVYYLPVGTHTVSIAANAGYNADDATITFNGQTVANGGTITIEAGATTFTLAASGAVPASSVSGGSSSSDDGMGLTDYLLIILVVLIVIMAIMVAMRLMRS